MNRSMKFAVHGVVLVATLTLGAPQALAASASESARTAQQPVLSAATIWPPHEGYTREDSFYGMEAKCQSVGRSGVSEGKWSAYLCVQELPFSALRGLYVKK
ncbi:hypothetical protein ACPEIF_34725 [Streptomyces sp. NPDC012600]|uniref:hypothetical protein n=1 Tax=Streptomyces sp. NPDC012600 TaxID=3415005 RepID=UPI003C2E8A08